MTLVYLMMPDQSILAQWFVEVDDSEIRAVWDMFQQVVPKRSGNFSTRQECEDVLNQSDWLPGQRAKYNCKCESDCDGQNSTEYYDDSQNNYVEESRNEIVVDDYKTQMMKRDLSIEKDKKEKAAEDRLKNENMKKELLGKLKGNKSFNQLLKTSELSQQGVEDIKNNQTEVGRDNSESSFTNARVKLRRGELRNSDIPVSPPAPVEVQKTLFEYVDKETKVVQSKMVEVQKEKIQILEKKAKIQETILEQKITIEKLKTEKIEVKEEPKKEEIDSLLLEAMQLLEDSETLNDKAEEEIKSKDKLIGEQEVLLNKLQTSYEKGKENPQKSEELLKELQGDKKK